MKLSGHVLEVFVLEFYFWTPFGKRTSKKSSLPKNVLERRLVSQMLLMLLFYVQEDTQEFGKKVLQEKMRILGPVLGRLQSELLKPYRLILLVIFFDVYFVGFIMRG